MKQQLQALFRQAIESLIADLGVDALPPETVQIDEAKDPKFGDFACNLAMVMAKPLRMPPRKLAEALIEKLPASALVDRIEIAGPGFINVFVTAAAQQQIVSTIFAQGEDYGHDRSGARGNILVEFVSANPTGPMHVGHGRQAAYGDALANILAAAGWTVQREYYINDAGRQVDVLAVSVWVRTLNRSGRLPAPVAIPSRGYPADYVEQVAERLLATGNEQWLPAALDVSDLPPDDADDKAQAERHLDAWIRKAKSVLGESAYAELRDYAIRDQLAHIHQTLDRFGVRYDRWYSERMLVESGAAAKALDSLRDSGHFYEQDGALWFATEKFGDEKDRVLIKADGAATYFANDLAYHVDKLARGHETLLDVWGADHHGYIARVRAAIKALTGRDDALNVQLIQFVTLSSGRMGKRSGNFVTFEELIREVGVDATRFFYLMRSNEQHLEFDLELARSQSNDNPVYYVQYAHARIHSVFRQAAERGIEWNREQALGKLERLTETHEKALLAALARYPEVVNNCALNSAPHTLTHYLRDTADALHSYYNAHAFLVDDAELRDARLALVDATGQVLRNGLGLIGVAAPEKM